MNAYVYLVMNGDNYIPGIIASGASLIKNKTKYKIIAMVTSKKLTVKDKTYKAVSGKKINLLKKIKYNDKNIFDEVIEVPYIYQEIIPMKGKNQNEIYSPWLNVSFTKWNCLKLDKYKKILFLDADTLIMKNVDHLFKLDCPAGIFLRKSAHPFVDGGIANSFSTIIKGDLDELGKKIPNKYIDHAIDNGNFVVDGSIILLQPNKKDYKSIIKMIKTVVNDKKQFGIKSSHSGSDEIAITYYYAKYTDNEWNHITPNYLYTEWGTQKKYFDYPLDKIYIRNFIGLPKVWDMKPEIVDQWYDTKIWWKFYKKILKQNSLL